jgi:hypothetical protein
MWKYVILLAVGLINGACDSTGPSNGGASPTKGALVVSIATGGIDPGQVSYVLTVDAFTSLALHRTGTAEVDVPVGHHTLRLLGVPTQCSVVPGTSLQAVISQHDTTRVQFSVTCKAPAPVTLGALRILVHRTGAIPSSARYQVWYDHYGAWDYGGGPLTELGELAPNDTLVAELPASSGSGADPYWYEFSLKGIPSNCNAYGARSNVMAGDTLDVTLTVQCPP